ncbi:hypothetical protein D3C83_171600 [compost metagenome]
MSSNSCGFRLRDRSMGRGLENRYDRNSARSAESSMMALNRRCSIMFCRRISTIKEIAGSTATM